MEFRRAPRVPRARSLLERGYPAEPGDVEVGGDVRERIQNPVPLHYPGMGQGQHGIGALLAAEDAG